MKITLIETGNAREDPFAQCWYTPDKSRFMVPLLALPILAALTPDDWETEILDEKLHDIDFEAESDLICMSFKSKDAGRTYRYAEQFRNRGKTVILGGVHATLLPEEAAQHADAVVAGEAEGIWKQVLDDFRTGNLQKIYYSPKNTPMETAPPPRFDLIDNDNYGYHAIQTSRGCVVGCEFCPVQQMYDGKSRNKPVQRVMEEVEAVLAIDPSKNIFFVDELFCAGNQTYQKELLAELRRNKIDFLCISDFKVIDPRYIWNLARSGCRKISINMPGTCLPQELQAVKAIQRLGIDVWGFFMFGFSFHGIDVFKKVVDFVHQSGMKNLTLTVMAPFPGTPMAKQMAERNAIISSDWALYDQCHIIYEPERMSAAELEEGFLWAWKKLENRLHIEPEDFLRKGRLGRSIKRSIGLFTLGAEKMFNSLTGKTEEPVDLESIIGQKSAEISITAHNTMETKRH